MEGRLPWGRGTGRSDLAEGERNSKDWKTACVTETEGNKETSRTRRGPGGGEGQPGGGGGGRAREAFEEMYGDLSDLLKIDIKPQI